MPRFRATLASLSMTPPVTCVVVVEAADAREAEGKILDLHDSLGLPWQYDNGDRYDDEVYGDFAVADDLEQVADDEPLTEELASVEPEEVTHVFVFGTEDEAVCFREGWILSSDSHGLLAKDLEEPEWDEDADAWVIRYKGDWLGYEGSSLNERGELWHPMFSA